MIFNIKINRVKIPNSELTRDIKRVAKVLKTNSITASDYRRHGMFHDETVKLRFGSWNNALKKSGLKPINRREEAFKEILADIKSVSVKLGKTSFSCYEYERAGRFKYSKVKRYFNSWGDALKQAGLKYIKYNEPAKQELLENLMKAWLKLGRQPKHNEIKKPLSIYGKNSYIKHFSSWQKALEELVVYLRKNKKFKVAIYCRKNYPKPGTKRKQRNLKKHKTPRNVDYRMRHLVLKRDGYRCRLCGSSPATGDKTELQIDHVVPWSSGGETTLNNLQTLCKECNIGKGVQSIKN